ncbi:protein Erp3p [Monosporozyma servazzii]
MLLKSVLYASLCAGISMASPLTFILGKGEQECFYTLTPDIDCEISYYFAVQHADNNDYKLNYDIYGPDSSGKAIISRSGERQGEWTFIGDSKGEYSFCFDNPSQYSERVVDLEIKYKCDRQGPIDVKRANRKQERNIPLKRGDGTSSEGGMSEQLHRSLDDKLDVIERQLYILERNMDYYSTRNERNHYTVSSTERRITMFSIYGILLIVGMSLGQILVLKWIFKESRRQQV